MTRAAPVALPVGPAAPLGRAALLLLALVCAACQESPAQGFEDFYAALVAGDARVLERLDAASRASVQQAAQARGVDAATALSGDGVRSTLRTIRELSRTDSTAALEVEDALGKTERVAMVLEDRRWRVTLAAPPVEAAAPRAPEPGPGAAP